MAKKLSDINWMSLEGNIYFRHNRTAYLVWISGFFVKRKEVVKKVEV